MASRTELLIQNRLTKILADHFTPTASPARKRAIRAQLARPWKFLRALRECYDGNFEHLGLRFRSSHRCVECVLEDVEAAGGSLELYHPGELAALGIKPKQHYKSEPSAPRAPRRRGKFARIVYYPPLPRPTEEEEVKFVAALMVLGPSPWPLPLFTDDVDGDVRDAWDAWDERARAWLREQGVSVTYGEYAKWRNSFEAWQLRQSRKERQR